MNNHIILKRWIICLENLYKNSDPYKTFLKLLWFPRYADCLNLWIVGLILNSVSVEEDFVHPGETLSLVKRVRSVLGGGSSTFSPMCTDPEKKGLLNLGYPPFHLLPLLGFFHVFLAFCSFIFLVLPLRHKGGTRKKKKKRGLGVRRSCHTKG